MSAGEIPTFHPNEVRTEGESGNVLGGSTISCICQHVEMLFRICYRRSRKVFCRECFETRGRTVLKVASGIRAVLESGLTSLTEVGGQICVISDVEKKLSVCVPTRCGMSGLTGKIGRILRHSVFTEIYFSILVCHAYYVICGICRSVRRKETVVTVRRGGIHEFLSVCVIRGHIRLPIGRYGASDLI